MKITGRSLFQKQPSQYVHWPSFGMVCNTDLRWLWTRHAEIDGRGLRVSGKLLQFLFREAGVR